MCYHKHKSYYHDIYLTYIEYRYRYLTNAAGSRPSNFLKMIIMYKSCPYQTIKTFNYQTSDQLLNNLPVRSDFVPQYATENNRILQNYLEFYLPFFVC
jgi:hypothetical protein